MHLDEATREKLEAAAFRALMHHLLEKRPDVQNIDLMNLAGFCRNCLSRWYNEAATAQGIEHEAAAPARDAASAVAARVTARSMQRTHTRIGTRFVARSSPRPSACAGAPTGP